MTMYSVLPRMDAYNAYSDGEKFTSPMPTEFGCFVPAVVQSLKAIEYPFEYQELPAQAVIEGSYKSDLAPEDMSTITMAAGLFIASFGLKNGYRGLRIMAGQYSQHTPEAFDDNFHIDVFGPHQTPTFVAIVSVGLTTTVMHGDAISEDFGETIQGQNAKTVQLKEGAFNLLDPLTVHRRPDRPVIPIGRLAIDFRSNVLELEGA